MSLKSTLVVSRQTVRLLFSDPQPVILFLVVPLLVMAITRPAMKVVLQGEGFPSANGAEQVIPAFCAFFAFFWVRSIGEQFFQERNWGTWERLRASDVTEVELFAGKMLPCFGLIAAQQLILFAAGAVIFDLSSAGPVLALAPVALALVVCVLALTLAVVAYLRTVVQVDAVTMLVAMLFGALGGALVPVATLPDLAEKAAPAVPTYWAMQSAREVLLEGEGLSATLWRAGVLLAFAAVFCLAAALRLRERSAPAPA